MITWPWGWRKRAIEAEARLLETTLLQAREREYMRTLLENTVSQLHEAQAAKALLAEQVRRMSER